ESVKKLLAEIIQEIQSAGKLTDIIHVKKLQGTKNCFRIRIGDYRLGMIVNGQKVELIRLLHRKEIYRYFP
ncbi:MAG TPA: type II toxin-antitoxin system RelE/ParE family toxin, partial [Bacteroidia bacterium]|nr:type II toxin-antitoxin system RelE/ParE family toxin [Bacteroidia bacterium]